MKEITAKELYKQWLGSIDKSIERPDCADLPKWLLENFDLRLKEDSYLNKPKYSPTEFKYWIESFDSNEQRIEHFKQIYGIEIETHTEIHSMISMAKLAEENKNLKHKLQGLEK